MKNCASIPISHKGRPADDWEAWVMGQLNICVGIQSSGWNTLRELYFLGPCVCVCVGVCVCLCVVRTLGFLEWFQIFPHEPSLKVDQVCSLWADWLEFNTKQHLQKPSPPVLGREKSRWAAIILIAPPPFSRGTNRLSQPRSYLGDEIPRLMEKERERERD